MKKLATLFSIAGFAIQYLLPIVVFGDIVPYTKDGFGRCLTDMGYIAVALVLYFASKKFKEWLLQKPKSIKRALILSLFPIVWWGVVFIGVEFLTAFVANFSGFWDKVIIFILLGRGCSVVSEALTEEGANK